MDICSKMFNNTSIEDMISQMTANKRILVVVIIASVIVLALYIAFYYLLYKLLVTIIGKSLSPIPRSITAIGIILLGSIFLHKHCYTYVKNKTYRKNVYMDNSVPEATNNDDPVYYYINNQQNDFYPYADVNSGFNTLYT